MAKTLTEALLESGVVKQSAIKKADEVCAAGGSFLTALVSQPGIDADLVGMIVARHHGLPYSHVVSTRIAQGLVAELTVRKLRTLQALPMDLKGNRVTVVAADPGVKADVEPLFARRGLKVDWAVAPVREIEAELGRLLLQEIERPAQSPSRASGAIPRPAGSAAAGDAPSALLAAPSSHPAAGELPGAPVALADLSRRLERAVARADAPGIVSEILSIAVVLGGSDVHIVFDAGMLSVRIRRDGVLRSLVASCPSTLVAAVVSRVKILAELDITETRKPQDGRARVELSEREKPVSVLMRVSTVPSRQGEKVTLRILEKGSRLLGLSEIGLSKANLNAMADALAHPNGIVLVTGPTGSGKTTTVYAALKHLISDAISVFTLEDPIEYELAGTYQSQVNDAIELTFPVMLRSLLRQDPNVILVGEMRDQETARIAFEAGLTGHFVLSTLHANSATAAITRLRELNVEPFVMGTCTRAIVAQRLTRRLCGCKRPIYRMPDDLVRIKNALGITGSRVFEPAGCPACSFIGFDGRIAIHEVLGLSAAVADLILNRANATQILAEARAGGFQPMVVDGFSKVLSGLTTAEEAIRQLGPPMV